jgi:DNA mismatch repair protein MutL
MEKFIDQIEILSRSVIEKIAAGEIIERPASVLKELIENSIDAGATQIFIDIEDSGFSCIRVIDNGRGMTSQNLQKSIVRHATSKIRNADDLYSIGTMGFRGEALASIGAVSRMTIASCTDTNGLGCIIECNGGISAPIAPVSHVNGTTVTVRDLFFNVPARKKFMKSRRSEHIALMRCIEQLAMPFPDIHFKATFEERPILDMPATGSVISRISQLAGVQFAKGLITCTGGAEGMEAVIYISSPDDARLKPRFQNLYVNKRKVECDQVLYAVREAFAQFIKSEFRPSFFCFIDIAPSRIDVNVHPTKLKIKFEDERVIFSFIFNIARQGIVSTLANKTDLISGHDVDNNEAATVNVPRPSSKDIPDASIMREAPGAPYTIPGKHVPTDNGQTELMFHAASSDDAKVLDSSGDERVQLSESVQEEAWNLIPCYQIHNMFILAPIKNGILLIDQHAAHERILYEQAMADLKQGRAESQQLLFPIVVELSPAEKMVIQAGKDYFVSFGFEIQDFGGNAVSISALPAFLKDSKAEAAVREMVRYLLEEKYEVRRTDSQNRFAAAFACGSAIKFGQKLSQEEMNALLNSLFGTENPYTCPHGRPTLVRMSLDELSRRFLR